MSLFAFHIPLVAEYMEQEKMNDRIRFIEIAGEACTKLLFDFIRATFPNATILPFYGSSEVEDSPIGMPCRAITGEEPLAVYHGKQSHYMELIDPETLMPINPQAGANGELVITAFPGKPSSFPLIRFRTGDSVRVVEEKCASHDEWSFTVVGRVGLDFLKVPGGVIRADEVERVLRGMAERVSDRFELHCFEEASPAGPLLRPVLHVETSGQTNFAALATEIAQKMRVAPSMTYADGVSMGRYLPLTCKQLDIVLGAKRKRIIRH